MRIIAMIPVICVHFSYNNEFYNEIVLGKRMYVMTVMRTFFMDCVPLFLVLTGYLMNRKTLNKKYYKGIKNTVEVYVLASLACTIYGVVAQNESFSIRSFVGNLLDFSAAPYSWYVEMYLGLFLLIPFLNLIYNGLETKKQKQILLVTMIAIVAIPGVFNLEEKRYPAWWENFYPVMYYFIGCYLCEYKVKMKKSLNLLLLAAHILIAGSWNYHLSYGVEFVWGSWQSWGAFSNMITTVLLFIFVTGIHTEGWNLKVKTVLKYLSGLCLGAYLCSSISDMIVYEKFNAMVPVVRERVDYFIPVVLCVVILSLGFSAIVDLCNRALNFIFGKIFVRKNK